MIYNLHTDLRLLQQEEERQQKILDADDSKVNIDKMVEELDVAAETKAKLKETLRKFPVLYLGVDWDCWRSSRLQLNFKKVQNHTREGIILSQRRLKRLYAERN